MEQHLKLDYDPNNPLPMLGNQGRLEKFLELQSSFMAEKGYARNSDAEKSRNTAVQVISKYSSCENFDPVVPYLAMNYFDRFFSRLNHPLASNMDLPQNALKNTEMRTTDKIKDLKIIAICCLTLAWKMRDSNFTTLKFLRERPDLSDLTTEQLAIMEIRILKELDWSLRAVTPFCFVPFFSPKFNRTTYGFRRRTINEIIIQSQDGIWISQFKPSFIAASALLAACEYLYPEQFIQFYQKTVSNKLFLKLRRKIEVCVDGMLGLCHRLKLTIESRVAENESTPKRQARAGDSPLQTCAKKLALKSAITPTTMRKQALKQIKEKEAEVVAATKMVEDRDDEQFDFKLKWRIGDSELNEEKIAQV